MSICEAQAPSFHYYLHRHIDVDKNGHGPLALQMLQHLCGDDERKWRQAGDAANFALQARLNYWNAIVSELDAVVSPALPKTSEKRQADSVL